eukprot:6464219-Amphidinium_carterae.1
MNSLLLTSGAAKSFVAAGHCRQYEVDTTRFVGKLMNHDDSMNDRFHVAVVYERRWGQRQFFLRTFDLGMGSTCEQVRRLHVDDRLVKDAGGTRNASCSIIWFRTISRSPHREFCSSLVILAGLYCCLSMPGVGTRVWRGIKRYWRHASRHALDLALCVQMCGQAD